MTVELSVELLVGGVTGVVAWLTGLTLMTLRRVTQVMQQVEDLKESHRGLKQGVVFRDVHEESLRSIHIQLEGIRSELSRLDRKVA